TFELAGTGLEKRLTTVLNEWRYSKLSCQEYRASFWIEWKSDRRVAGVIDFSLVFLPAAILAPKAISNLRQYAFSLRNRGTLVDQNALRTSGHGYQRGIWAKRSTGKD